MTEDTTKKDDSAGSDRVAGHLLWAPAQDAAVNSEVGRFADFLRERTGFDWHGDFQGLWSWSVENDHRFWDALWDWHGVIGEKGARTIENEDAMPGARFFPDARICYAENMLRDADERAAIAAHCEDGRVFRLTRRELKERVMRLAGWLRGVGIGPGDRVAAYVPCVPEALMALLATSAVGAIFSSCSPDFGLGGARDRFGQISPRVLITCDGYVYAGKRFDRLDTVRQLADAVPSIRHTLVIPFLDESPDLAGLPDARKFEDALEVAPIEEFARVGFNDPLYIMYSSGTTGAPKCIVHGVGGVTVQHAKEIRLHANLLSEDAIFFFSTCGWMMWNWLVSGLMAGAKIVTYEGNPLHPGPERLWRIAEEERLTHFGISAKYIDAVANSRYRPVEAVDLASLRVIMSTGSPLSSEGFDFVYESIHPEAQLCSMSGGTDLASCFVLGTPTQPVRAGEIQTRGLGMSVAVLDDEGEPVVGRQGELCCTRPFPSMPVMFWGDDDDAKYRAAYFEHFEGVWRHGDWATLTESGGMVIHGRSDATLNPGGVRIGTAEIYRQVETLEDVEEALVVGLERDNDVHVVLFVRMKGDAVLDDSLRETLKSRIRTGASPRHVPRHVIAVPDIPRTRSGKITELAVRELIHGRPVKNTEALANADALEHFKDLAELAG